MPSTHALHEIDFPTLMPAATWTLLRQWLRHRLEAHAKLRTVALGPAMRLCFDDELTLRMALQDELLADGGIRQARLAQLADALASGDDEWCATLAIAPPGAASAAAASVPALLEAAATQIHVQIGVERLCASAFAPAGAPRFQSRVRALRFALTPAMHDALDAGACASLVCTHPRYFWRRRLPTPTLRELRRGLEDHRATPRNARPMTEAADAVYP